MKSVIDEYLHLDPLRTRVFLHRNYSEPAVDIEARRVLRPGGRFAATVNHRDATSSTVEDEA